MYTYIANIMENYIYNTVREYYKEYRTKYGVNDTSLFLD